MDITPPVAADRQLIHGYGDGGFRVSGTRYIGPILVLPRQTPAHTRLIQRLDAAGVATRVVLAEGP